MGDDGLGLLSMAVCFDFHSINVVQLSNQNPYFYQFRCHHPLITQLSFEDKSQMGVDFCSKISLRELFDFNF